MKNKDEWLNVNGYHIFHSKDNTYTAYNSDGKIVYEIDADGLTTLNTKNGDTIEFYNLNINSIKPNTTIKFRKYEIDFSNDEVIRYVDNNPCSEWGSNFTETTYTDNGFTVKECMGNKNKYEIINESIMNNDGSIIDKDYIGNCTRYYNADNTKDIVYDDGTVIHYDESYNIKYQKNKDGSYIYFDDKGHPYIIKSNDDGTIEHHMINNEDEVYQIKYEDGRIKYVNEGNETITTYLDGTYQAADGEKGTYVINSDGDIVCISSDGTTSLYNKHGIKYRSLDKDNVFVDYITDKQIVRENGKVTYSLRNHIEYDEDAYNKILSTLNSIDGSGIDGTCSSIENSISSFPDSYQEGLVSGIRSNINGHVDLIKSLSEMTNYSLLAYQTCDESLMDGLKLLVDSLFDEGNRALGEKFKKTIESTIEDRDNDNIFEYKYSTNFKMLSENAIVNRVFTDQDGNKWYLNKNDIAIALEGENFRINYGGEEFSLTYDENGIVKVKDSNGKYLNIFGEYNVGSRQFGGDQSVLDKAYKNQYVNDILNEYFPDASQEAKISYLYGAQGSACGNVAMSNLVFKKFEGREENFYKTFGYPMYEIKYDSKTNGLAIDYNYEPLIMDLYCHENPNIKFTDGTDKKRIKSMESYLKEKYNVSLSGYYRPWVYYGERGFTLYKVDDPSDIKTFSRYAGHAMIGVGKTKDGKIIVSSWGEKYILERSSSAYDRDYNKQGVREYW